jgi:hypothetical protein
MDVAAGLRGGLAGELTPRWPGFVQDSTHRPTGPPGSWPGRGGQAWRERRGLSRSGRGGPGPPQQPPVVAYWPVGRQGRGRTAATRFPQRHSLVGRERTTIMTVPDAGRVACRGPGPAGPRGKIIDAPPLPATVQG